MKGVRGCRLRVCRVLLVGNEIKILGGAELLFQFRLFSLSVGVLIKDLFMFLEQDVRRLELTRLPTDIRLRPNL